MELNHIRPHGLKYLRFENSCPKSGVSPLHANRFFEDFETLTAYVFGVKHDIDNRASALEIYAYRRGLVHRPKTK